MKGPDNFSQLAVMGNICADLLAGAKTWERCGDWRELLSVRFRKALTPERLCGKTFRLSQVTGRPWCGAGGTDNTFSSDPTWQGRPDRGTERLPWTGPDWGGCQDSHLRNVTISFFFFLASFLCCVTFMKSYTLHIFLICFLCQKKGKRTKSETTWSSQKPEDMLESWPTTD